jgi:hypothetical protein
MVKERSGHIADYYIVFTDCSLPSHYIPHDGVKWINVDKFNQYIHTGTEKHGTKWFHFNLYGSPLRQRAKAIREIMGLS